jgi:hypothetical protein
LPNQRRPEQQSALSTIDVGDEVVRQALGAAEAAEVWDDDPLPGKSFSSSTYVAKVKTSIAAAIRAKARQPYLQGFLLLVSSLLGTRRCCEVS